MKNVITHSILIFVFAILMIGCGDKPDHNANWYYYWEKDDVIPGMDRAGSPASRWAWGTQAHYGGASGPHNKYGLTDLVITSPNEASHRVIHRTRNIPQTIGATVTLGIEMAAGTAYHEKQHIVNYNQIRARGGSDRDNDGLNDAEENKAPYWFLTRGRFRRDTYNIHALFPGGQYNTYGDNEFIARMAEAAGVAAAKKNEDWSKDGAQWRR